MSAKDKNTGKTLSRRDYFGVFFRPLKKKADAHTPNRQAKAPPETVKARKAILLEHNCLAFRSLSCTTCFEHCPVPGAITMNRGIPRIHQDTCTGCDACHEVCPAPKNAIAMQEVESFT